MPSAPVPSRQPEGKEPYIRLLVSAPGATPSIRCACEAAIGRYLHWCGRGVLCPSVEPECQCGVGAGPRRWYAHVFGYDLADGQRAILQVPYNAWIRFAAADNHLAEVNLAVGKKVSMKRMNNNPRSSCYLLTQGYDSDKKRKGLTVETAEKWLETVYARIDSRFKNGGER